MPELAEPEFKRLARAYGTSARTIRRWHAEGIDVLDSVAVGLQLAASPRPRPSAIRTTAAKLEHELSRP